MGSGSRFASGAGDFHLLDPGSSEYDARSGLAMPGVRRVGPSARETVVGPPPPLVDAVARRAARVSSLWSLVQRAGQNGKRLDNAP